MQQAKPNALPSEDHRFQSAAGGVWQHRVNNRDGEDDWVFYDRRFNPLHGPDGEFPRFPCETVHPAVRPSVERAFELVNIYNEQFDQTGGSSFAAVKSLAGRSFEPGRQPRMSRSLRSGQGG